MKRIGLVFFDPYSINKGTAALSYSMLNILDEIAEEHNIEHEYVFLEPANPPYGLVDNNLRIMGKEIPIEILRVYPNSSVKQKIVRFIYYRQHLKSLKIDCAFDIGEGDSYSDIYGEDRFNLFDVVKRMYIKRKIPYFILPQTLGPFKGKHIVERARNTLNQCSVIYARDNKTKAVMEDLLPNKKLYVMPDLAFYLPYVKQQFNNNKIKVGFNVSGLLWYGGYTRDNQFELKTDYRTLVKKVIEYFVEIPDVELHLIPHVLHDKNTLDNDWPISLDLYTEYRNRGVKISQFFMTPIEAKSYISGMDFFVGARLHATIAAFSSGVPVCPTAYSRKFTGLYNDTYGYNSVADLMNMSTEQAFEMIIETYATRKVKKDCIDQILPQIFSQKSEFKKVIYEFLQTIDE